MDQSMPAAAGFPCRMSTSGPDQTRAVGERAAGLISGGEILLLYGPLGAGKTCFVQGLCRGLTVTDQVVSPTFTLINTYQGRLKVHHLDFYRVEPGDDLQDIGVPGVLDEVGAGSAIAVVEWPALLLPELSPEDQRLELLALPGPETVARSWYLRGVPQLPDLWRDLWRELTPKEGPEC